MNDIQFLCEMENMREQVRFEICLQRLWYIGFSLESSCKYRFLTYNLRNSYVRK